MSITISGVIKRRIEDGLWQDENKNIVHVAEMSDERLRNVALFVLGMGYRRCGLRPAMRNAYLELFKREWERRRREGTDEDDEE